LRGLVENGGTSFDRIDLGYNMERLGTFKLQIQHISDVYDCLLRDSVALEEKQTVFKRILEEIKQGLKDCRVEISFSDTVQDVALSDLETVSLRARRSSKNYSQSDQGSRCKSTNGLI
jgi:hypothetical protein